MRRIGTGLTQRCAWGPAVVCVQWARTGSSPAGQTPSTMTTTDASNAEGSASSTAAPAVAPSTDASSKAPSEGSPIPPKDATAKTTAKTIAANSNGNLNAAPQSLPTPFIDVVTPIPAGFERFYQRELTAGLPNKSSSKTAQETAVQLTELEQKLLDEARIRGMYHSRVRRASILGLLILGIAGYKSYKMYALLSEPDMESLRTVLLSKATHLARYLDATGHTKAMSYFIDARTFHTEETERGRTVLVSVGSYFPFLPLMLLCLLPMMAMMNTAFSTSARHAAKRSVTTAPEKSRFRFKKEVGVTTRLSDVAGLTEAKHEVIEVIDFLKNPMRYRALGAKLPKGVLLDGPPGVGKTLLAKAVAGEAMVNFVSCSGSEFEEVYVGVGAQRVRELFKQARAARPCVVFIDEIDAFGRKRQSDKGGNSRGTLNAFLSELDGFHDASGIIVLAATNRADVLDGALTRSGRFDRKISIDKPPHKDRVAIAKVHLAPLRIDPASTIDDVAEALASLTPGCSGADIYNICNESAIIASREDRDFINMTCFQKAIDRVLVGLEKKATKLSDFERARLAYHEAGHVILNWFQALTDPVVKTSIAPRGGSLGTTQKLPQDVFIRTQDRLHQAMVARLGGFVAEEHFFNDLSSSAAEDLQRVTDAAREEICTYGMDPEIGNFGYEMGENDLQKPYGPKKEDAIDVAVARLVEQCAASARALLRQYEQQVQIVAGTLLKQETLTAQELWVLLGDRPEMTQEFRKYLES